MDSGKPKKKRSELELLLGNGDVGGLSSFSPRLPALSISGPALAEATAESDEQLARRLHEELNGTRMTRRGSKAVTEDGLSLSPMARGVASPHAKSKVETPRAIGGPGRASLPSLPSIYESVPAASDAVVSVAAEARTAGSGSEAAGATAGGACGSAPGAGYGAGAGLGAGTGAGSAPGAPTEGGSEAVKRKRNSVPARELHLLLQQASSAAGRAEVAFSPIRGARGGSLASTRADASAASIEPNHAQQQNRNSPHQQGGQPLPRHDSDRNNGQHSHQHQPGGSSTSAPVAPSRGAPPPPPLLPPKLEQRFLTGFSGMKQPASASNDVRRADGSAAPGGGSGGVSTTATAVTPSGVLDGGGSVLLSGPSLEGSSAVSQSQSQSLAQSQGREGTGFGAAYLLPEAGAASAASLTAVAPRALGAIGASIGGCSSTDETENDNNCAAAVVCAGDGGPSATSPRPLAQLPLQLPPPLPPSSGVPQQKQYKAQTNEPGHAEEDPHFLPQARNQRHVAGGPPAGTAAAAQLPSGQAKQTPAPAQDHSLSGPLKVPKLPMIRAGRGWYRGRLMRESMDGQRVLVDVPGTPNTGSTSGTSSSRSHHQPFWLTVNSDRIWRGSYKGKDWKHLGDGAWEPKPTAFKRGKLGSSSNGLPLPLPLWALEGVGAGAEAEAQPSSATAAGGDMDTTPFTAADPRPSKRNQGAWSSPGETSDDTDVAEDQQPQQQPQQQEQQLEQQQEQQQQVGQAEGPSTRSRQRSHRRSSPAAALISVASVKSALAAVAAAAMPAAAVAAECAGMGSEPAITCADGATATTTVASAGAACPEPVSEAKAAVPRDEAGQPANNTSGVEQSEPTGGPAPAGGAVAKARVTAGPLGAAADAPVTSWLHSPRAQLAADGVEAPGRSAEAPARASSEGASDSAGSGAAAAATAATTTVVAGTKAEDGKAGIGSGSGVPGAEDGSDEAGAAWEPGVVHPRRHQPRRAHRRQRRLRTPFDGLQLPFHHHQSQPNPYAFYPVLTDESGGDGDASDAEHGGGIRRGSGDGAAATAAHHGSRRRAAARAAAVAAAAARAEAEAEEEEQEEILMGRRPPRRDRFHSHSQPSGGGGGLVAAGRRNHHSQQQQQHHHHHRSRSGARADYYLYGDSSGNLDDPYGADYTAHGRGSSVRPHASSRGNSQPAPEYGSGGSGGWESVQWQATAVAAAGDTRTDGGAPQRNRRKGKPSRSRMDGEGDAWCCGEDEWELEAGGGAWARMPEVLRRLYCAPAAPSAAAADGNGGKDGGAGRMQQPRQHGVESGRTAFTHRQSDGGPYFGALQAPSKRRRVYEEDPAASPDDLDLDLEMEVDDHERDADYLPPHGAAAGCGSRRSSGFSIGRRCSANGGAVAITKRQRGGDTAANFHHHYSQYLSGSMLSQQHLLQYGEAAVTAKPRFLLGFSPPGWGSGTSIAGIAGGPATALATGFAGAAPVARGVGASVIGDGIPAGLAGLLEAALGQDAAAMAADDSARAVGASDATRQVPDVKMESGLAPDAVVATAVAGRLTGPSTDITAAAAGGSHPQGMMLSPPPPGDPHGAHVALSDSSAAPSGAEDGKCAGGGGGAAATGVTIDASGPAACANGSVAAALLSQQHGSSSGGVGAGGCSAGLVARSSSPQPSSGLGVQVQVGHVEQLRSNTPTRAKRTGRPPSAGLGAGAPLPKLPALSYTASLRVQTLVAAAGAGGLAAAAAVNADGAAASGSPAVAAATAAAAAAEAEAQLLSVEVMEAQAQSLGEPQALGPTDERTARPMGQSGSGSEPGDDVPQSGSHGDASDCQLWRAAGGGTGCDGSGGETRPTLADDGGGCRASIAAGLSEADGAHTGQGGSIFTAGAAAAAIVASARAGTVSGTDGAVPATKVYGDARDGTGSCVIDAIGALMYEKQPAMRQLAIRAQLELDSIGRMVAAQHKRYGTVHSQDEQSLLQQSHEFLVAQQQQRLLSGRGGGGGIISGRASGMLRSVSPSAAASPPAPDPLISNLPSVEVVVSLFSARTPYGSAQQALADLVAGSAALPLFR